MKEILKVMWFDFLCAKPVAMVSYLLLGILSVLFSLFFSPAICAYMICGAIIFIIPLQNIAEKSDFNKLYGILPIHRKNITSARFLLIFCLFFVTELIEIVMGLIIYNLKLYKILPNQTSATMQMVDRAFHDLFLTFIIIVGSFALVCLIFSYMEMMGQIFGRENEMKIILITLGVISVVAIGFFELSDHGIIPQLKLPSIPESLSGRVILGVVVNAVVFGLCMLFGKITANQLAKREL